MEPGDTVIDATAGNGHDTLYLAGLTGEHGRVIAIDIQETAVAAARQRITNAGQKNVDFQLQSHADPWPVPPQTVKAVMFNLGYLPGSDRTTTTAAETTRIALQHAEEALQDGGIITVISYRGHPGGAEEEAAVRNWCESLAEGDFQTLRHVADEKHESSPVLFVIRKQAALDRELAVNSEPTEKTETIELDRFLKMAQLASSGGQAKHLIRSGEIQVNGEVETRRGRKLRHGDVVTASGEDYVIETDA